MFFTDKMWILTLLGLATSTYTYDEKVLVLDADNFNSALDEFGTMMVMFYAPWCGLSRKLSPEYMKAAEMLHKHDPPFILAKVDGEANPVLKDLFKVAAYPTLILFKGRQVIEYQGSRTKQAIVAWVLKKAANPVVRLTELSELNAAIQTNKVTAVYFGAVDSNFEIFQLAAAEIDGPAFVSIDLEAAFTEYQTQPSSVVVFKDFDDKREDFTGEFSLNQLKHFLDIARVPWAMPFDFEAMDYILERKHTCLIVLRDDKDHDTYFETLQRIGKLYRNLLCVAYADSNHSQINRLSDYFGIRKQPSSLIIEPAEPLKYIKEGKPTFESLTAFISEWRKGELQPVFKSQPIPTKEYEGDLMNLVGKNFESVVYNRNKDVLVQFFVPWSPRCQTLGPEYEKLAIRLRSVSTIEITRIDGAENEVRGFQIRDYPTIIFFPANDKEGIVYHGDLTESDLLSFIQAKAHFPLNPKSDL